MTLDELIERLGELVDTGDTEVAHAEADDALLAYINDRRVDEAYQRIDKWYA